MNEFLNKIGTLGLTLETNGGDLLLKGKEGKLTATEIDRVKRNSEIMSFIRDNKSQLIAYLQANTSNKSIRINKEDVAAIYELSPLQEGILFHSLYDPQATAYKTQFQMEFEEGLQLTAFQQAWEYMIRNHSILRTAFIHDQLSIPVQCVYKKIDFKFEQLDFSGLQGEELETRYQELLNTERTKAFDFKKAPLMRITLVTVPNKAIRMIWTKHHILWDGWSGQILMKEFMIAYKAYVDGQTPPLREEDKFEDYIRFLKKINKEEEQAFWKHYLQAFDTPSLLPFVNHAADRSKQQDRFSDVYLDFDEAQTDKIITFSKQSNITVSSLTQGIWALLLAKYTSCNDIVFGVTVSGRPPETKYEEKIGLYINTIPFRAQVDPEESISSWLKHIQDGHVKAREFQYTSLSNIKRSNNIQHAFFDTVLVFRNFPVNKQKAKQGAEQLHVKNYAVQENNNYPLSVQADLRETLTIDFKFNSALIDEAHVTMIAGHFQFLMDQIISHPDILLKDLNYTSDQEKQKLLHDFNHNPVAYPKHITILDLINEQVNKTPDQVAVEFEGQQLTYRQLQERSNQLANHLINKGIKKGDLVAICMERSLEMSIGLLGILKSGAAYVPIDSNYPPERIHYVLEDIHAKIIVTSSPLASLFETAAVQLVQLDHWNALNQESVQEPLVTPAPEDIMYVIYTSGSTGKPKGVMNAYAGVVNRLLWAKDSYRLNAQDTVLQKTTFCFDVSVWELFLPLFTGAKLLFAKPDAHKDNAYLKNIIEQKQVTILHFVPSMLSAFLLELSPGDCSSLKICVCSGEALQLHHIHEFRRVFDAQRVRLQNLYGPTEAAIDVTFWEVPDSPPKALIGKPVANTPIYILDSLQRIQPTGVPGELCIGGIQVSKGYLGKAALTAEKYIKDPFTKKGNIYRTGDLAKWNPDGTIEYIGRIDNQVKIRGYRIEPGEIETVLLEFDSVQQAAVLVKTGNTDHAQLIAFIVSKETPPIQALREFLKTKLPAYMVPNAIISCERFPLTSNGKLDRKKLLDAYKPETSPYEEPQTDYEKKLAAIWSNLLGIEQVGLHDDFFLIGGDSILLIRMLVQIKKQFKKDIDLYKVYNNTVLKNLAAYLEHLDDATGINNYRAEKEKEFLAMKETLNSSSPFGGSIEEVYPMSDIQKGMIYEYYKNFREGVYHDQFAYLIPPVDPVLFRQAFEYLAAKHETLRTSFEASLFEGLQLVHKTVSWEVPVVDLQDKSKEKQEEHIHAFFETERKKRFDITRAPLWKAHLFRLSPDRMVYTFQFHHAILDGWSLASLNTELFDVYEKLASHQTITPAPLKSTNKLSVIDSLMIKEDVSYSRFWQDYLNGSERNDLFSEKMMPDQVQENFEAVDMEQLEKLAENLKTTPRTIFLGCYLYALSLMTFEKDITIGVVTNNRPLHEDGDKLLGCFLNTVPLRINMESSWTWKDFILALHKNINETKGKDRLPLTHIHKSIHQDHPSVHPLFDCIFNYVNFHIYDSLHQTGSAGKFKDLYNDLSPENQFQLQSFENVNSTFIFTLRSSNGKISGTFKSKKEFKSGIPLNEFVTYFNTALQLMVTKPNRLMQNRDVLPPAVTARLLNEFNSTKADDPLPTTFLEKLDTTVMRFPDRIAVSFEDRHISYSELNRAANQFAHFLIKKYKINNQDKIGVKIERNEQLPVVLLGILKTGAAYVPLDINYPKSRIEYIERNSDCRLVITDKEWNAFKNEQQQYSHQTPEVEQKSSDLAYIIYTSGTTGHPKGVMIHHNNVLQLINWAEQTFDQTKFDVVFAGTSHCFDISVFEMFYSLSVGKRVRILSNALQIKDYLQEEKILINTVPSSLRTLLEQGADLKNVRFVNLAGEIFPVDVADKLRKWDTEVRNLYGPSEDTTYSTCYKLSDKDYKTIPIGQPLPNTQAFILNENADLLPPGVDGYLYLSGEGLSSGYANNPELTAEKFIYNPRFDQLRMYNTGDIARWTADGIIEYVGRKDNQVKLKGFRIELEEIENAISRFSGSIGQVVTTVKEDQHGKALVAYYVSKESTDKTELRHFLSTQLPVYMIPHYFIQMPAIPLTPNGKTDLKALPDLLQGDLIKRTYQPPVTALQQQLVRIWEDVLKSGQVGISDNFFELGGDSLLALRAISIIQKQMEITIPPDIYFRLSTIQELSDYLESARVANSTEDVQEYDVFDL